MSIFDRLKYLYFAYSSKPAGRRQLYRAAGRERVRSILQLGIGDVELACRLIEIAVAAGGDDSEICYTGIDLFEARPATLEPISLKAAHQKFSRIGAKIKLVPGDAFEGLARTANSQMGTDLVIIGSGHDDDALSRAWFYVPRMLHDGSLVFQQESCVGTDEEAPFVRVVATEIHRMAGHAPGRRAA